MAGGPLVRGISNKLIQGIGKLGDEIVYLIKKDGREFVAAADGTIIKNNGHTIPTGGGGVKVTNHGDHRIAERGFTPTKIDNITLGNLTFHTAASIWSVQNFSEPLKRLKILFPSIASSSFSGTGYLPSVKDKSVKTISKIAKIIIAEGPDNCLFEDISLFCSVFIFLVFCLFKFSPHNKKVFPNS